MSNRLTPEIVEYIINTISSEEFKNCTEIAQYVGDHFGRTINRRTISDINIGASYRQKHIHYPISKKYARNFLTNCSVCGEKSTATFEGKEYCRKHYMQMYRHGKISEETIYDPNVFIEKDDHYVIILKNKFFEIVGEAKIDKEDYEKVKQYKWYAITTNGVKLYCQGTLERGEKVRLHHFVLGIRKNELKGLVVDHINGDSLDNRKENLRIVTQQENMRNMKSNNPMTGIKKYQLKDGTWRYSSRITHNYQTITLGTFNTLEEAQEARRKFKEKIES